MNINQRFDYPLAAWSSASSARSGSINPDIQHLADAVGYIAQALTQQNLKLDTLLARQTEILKRLNG